MSVDWVTTTQSKIYTIVSTKAKKNLVSSFPDIRFTEEEESGNSLVNYPNVCIHFLPSAELGKDLERDDINGFICGATIQVTVSTKQGEKSAIKVLNEVLKQFKSLLFEVTLTIERTKTGTTDTKQVIARVRRYIYQDEEIK